MLAAAFEQDAARTSAVAGASHLAPGLAVLFMPKMTAAAGGNIHLTARRGKGNGNHVPEIFRHDMSDDEVDFRGGVCLLVAPGFHDVTGAVGAPGRFDLNPPELLAGIEDEIVALAFSPGFGDAETEASGFGEKGGFRGFAMRFGRGEADGMNLRDAFGRGPSWLAENEKRRSPQGRAYLSSYF